MGERAVDPTISLRGLDPSKVLRDYQEGKYRKYQPVAVKIKLASLSTLVLQSYNTDSSKGIYFIKDRSNMPRFIATTESSTYETFSKGEGVRAPGGRCAYCLQDFTHDSIGIPIKMERRTLYKTDDHDVVVTAPHYVFWTTGVFCNFRDALGFIRSCKAGTFPEDSEKLLMFMWSLDHPDEVLTPSPDPRLLDSLGGPLTRTEFDDTKYRYHPTGQFILLPAKLKFYRLASPSAPQ